MAGQTEVLKIRIIVPSERAETLNNQSQRNNQQDAEDTEQLSHRAELAQGHCKHKTNKKVYKKIHLQASLF